MLEREPAQIQDQFMRPLGSNRTLSATYAYRNRWWAFTGPFFLSVSKGFGGGDRPPETAKTVKIGL